MTLCETIYFQIEEAYRKLRDPKQTHFESGWRITLSPSDLVRLYDEDHTRIFAEYKERLVERRWEGILLNPDFRHEGGPQLEKETPNGFRPVHLLEEPVARNYPRVLQPDRDLPRQREPEGSLPRVRRDDPGPGGETS